MNTQTTPKKSLLLQAFLVFFIVHTNQMGVGIAGVQRIIFFESKQDAWISVCISYIGMVVVIAAMCYILRTFKDKDLFDIHVSLFGKFIGTILNLVYITYLLAGLLSIILGYTEIVQAWIFPDMKSWTISSFILFLTLYGVFGGIRTVVGVSFLGFFLAIWLVLLIYEPIRYMEWTNFLPILEASPKELLRGAYKTSFTVLGLEILYFVYPYIRNKEKVHIYAQLGVFFTFLLILLLTIVAIGYYSAEQLEKTIWATLSMFKIIQFPNLERFEFFAVSMWLVIILPNTLFMMWAATKGLKKIIKIKQRKLVIICSILIIALTMLFNRRVEINLYIDVVGLFGFGVIFVYTIILFLIVFVRNRIVAGRKAG
ncbi:GerAB/ArcD/ProY family transporter [Sutcliffiella halmapala]|uniref:GerAB/ArcD/ProY family transporter n=1 Tax=Sutcliffiella halmapala TaxID=79882 RepID=UPI0009950EE7|nr:GerAB/ArcD/ProY family transporter [Sutcliffiella halmapala]